MFDKVLAPVCITAMFTYLDDVVLLLLKYYSKNSIREVHHHDYSNSKGS